ncbi:MAG: heavy metal-responsive transcriptional regulator [Actinobacteria bacterium]|nr:heavy metal-responsive transcriptional regulator [Actinomycetota bacterium]
MKIGEAAHATGMTTKTLRFYEAEGLLPPATRAPNGYREYGQDTLARLDFINRSRTAGLTLAQTRSILRIRDRGEAPCMHVQQVLTQHLADIDGQIAALLTLRATVAEFAEASANSGAAECDPDRVCSYL